MFLYSMIKNSPTASVYMSREATEDQDASPIPGKITGQVMNLEDSKEFNRGTRWRRWWRWRRCIFPFNWPVVQSLRFEESAFLRK